MTDTGSNAEIEAVDDIYNEIMYHVLGQFLVTKDNKNVATIFQELVNEFKNTQEIKNTLQELTHEIKTMNNELREIKKFYNNSVLTNTQQSQKHAQSQTNIQPQTYTQSHTNIQPQTYKKEVSEVSEVSEVIEEKLTNNLKIREADNIAISSSQKPNIVSSSVSVETVANS
jgi:hypothetical protein